MNDILMIYLLIGAPLVGFAINGLLYKKSSVALAGLVGFITTVVPFVFSVLLFLKLQESGESEIQAYLWHWFSIEDLQINLELGFNRISSIMCLVITGVGALIHLFSIKYMEDDASPHKYFSFLSLFIFSMLLLVLGTNLLVTFIGWEGVGLCSYLLIGYWNKDLSKSAAGMKAFIVNRTGDAGFIVGMIILYLNLGTLNYVDINVLALESLGSSWVSFQTAAVIALFIGVAGKSAQLPLFVWLPDAMAGPTPVSALIHAATMVTAGIFVLFRLNGLLFTSPQAMMVISHIGALTAFVAAFIAMSQWDLKKVLAYSTVSQLGYMVLAIGVGSYVGAVFHLITHAFFKGLMFLGAGSVIHGLSGEQDMRKMGGLSKAMPITYVTFFCGWIAIIGLPFFSGFFSKDEILLHIFINQRGAVYLWFLGFLTAGMTAFYMTRLMAHVFWSPSRWDDKVKPHEGGWLFSIPLLILALLSLVAGIIGLPHVFSKFLPGHPKHMLGDWLLPMVHVPNKEEPSLIIESLLMFSSVALVGAVTFLTYLLYIKKNPKVDMAVSKVKKDFLLKASRNLLYIDDLYSKRIVAPFKEISGALWLFIDIGFIDNAFTGFARFASKVGAVSENIQTGRMQTYISVFVVTMTLVLLGVLFI